MMRSVSLLLALAMLTGACRRIGSEAGPDRPPRVLATVGMIGDLAARVAGPDALIETLMGPGTDPHFYRPSTGDVARLSRADLVLYNGLHLEGRMGDVLESMRARKPVVRVTAAIPEASLIRPDPGADGHDPHVWNDVHLWAMTVDPIAAALADLRPDRAEAFRARAADLRRELEALDAWVARRVGRVPADRRVLVTAHDAFAYLGRRYGIEVRGLQGISTVSQAGVKDIDRLAEFICARRLPAIFVESSVPTRAIEALQAACRSRGHEVAIGGELYSDAMGAAGTPEGTYAGMMRHNIDTLVQALGGGLE